MCSSLLLLALFSWMLISLNLHFMNKWYGLEVCRTTFIAQFVWTDPPLSYVLQVIFWAGCGPGSSSTSTDASCLGNEGFPSIFSLCHSFMICSFMCFHASIGCVDFKCSVNYCIWNMNTCTFIEHFHILLYMYISSEMIIFHYISIL